MQFSSISPIGASTRGKSGPGSNTNKGILHIPQSPSITGTSPSDCLVSYRGHLLMRRVLLLSSEVVGIFYNPSRLGKPVFYLTKITRSIYCGINCYMYNVFVGEEEASKPFSFFYFTLQQHVIRPSAILPQAMGK